MTQGRTARSTVGSLLIISVSAWVIGGLVMLVAWPDTQDYNPSWGGFVFGAVIAGIGTMALLVVVIAAGVRLGIELAREGAVDGQSTLEPGADEAVAVGR